MDSQLVPISLAVIAVVAVIHAGTLIWAALQGRRMARRIDELQRRVEQELSPNVARLSRVTENLQEVTQNLQEISQIARTEASRIEGVVEDTARKVQETTDVLRNAVVKPLEPLVHIAAFLKGIRRGVEVYSRLRGFEPRGRASEADREDDEHLFI